MTHLQRVQRENFRADALLVTSAVNQRWVSGFDFTDGVVLITSSRAWLITDFRYIEAARREVADLEVVLPQETVNTCLGGILKLNGIKSVAVEDMTLPAAELAGFRKRFADTEFVFGASALLDGLREYKDEGEIEKMKAAQAITDAAFDHILGYITPDRTEAEVALELEFFMRRSGADGTAFPTIAVSGSASSMPHGVPRGVKLERGFLTMDFGARVDGYCSDMTRTVVVGRADGEMKKLYYTVLDAQKAALDALYSGERGCFKLDLSAREIIDGAGYNGCFGHSLGHGVGMYIHENPRLAPRVPASAKLAPGQVVTVEPGIYIPGKYGCRIEDMIALTEDGVYNFTRSPKEMIEL